MVQLVRHASRADASPPEAAIYQRLRINRRYEHPLCTRLSTEFSFGLLAIPSGPASLCRDKEKTSKSRGTVVRFPSRETYARGGKSRQLGVSASGGGNRFQLLGVGKMASRRGGPSARGEGANGRTPRKKVSSLQIKDILCGGEYANEGAPRERNYREP